MRPKIKDVARRAGVSEATVSRVLSGYPHISPETRRKVTAAIEEMHYTPSRVARGLRRRQSQTIGMIISDIQNPFFTALVRAVEDVAAERGFSVILCNADEDTRKEQTYLGIMLAEQVSGIILTPASEDEPALLELVRRQIFRECVPLVSVDRAIKGLDTDTVVLDNVRAARDLAACLVRSGHRRIGCVVGPSTNTTGRQRLEGYRLALAEAGIAAAPELIHQVPPREAEGFKALAALIDLPEPPTAVFAGNNLLTTGIVKAIHARGLSIPDDVALAGFDDMNWTSILARGLTVIQQPTYEMGRRAAQLLFERMASPTLPARRIVFSGQLIVRESSGPHRQRQGNRDAV